MASGESKNEGSGGNTVARWTFIFTVIGAVGFVAAVFLFIW